MELLPHQVEAVEKFANIPACLVGDKMGVGKTVTGIGRDLRLRQDYGREGAHIRTLIVCQKSGISVWHRHLRLFGIPDNRILAIDPRDREPFKQEIKRGAHRYDYYIVHWDVLTKLEDLHTRPKITWHHVIGDEIHFIKNQKSARTREFKKLDARVRSGLSGTPADDKPWEIWSILNWLYPTKYKSFWRFYDAYVEYETGHTGYRIPLGIKNADRFQESIEPFYISRTLHDVRADMPKKTHSIIETDMTPRQRREYERMEEFCLAEFREEDPEEIVAPNAIAVFSRLMQMTAGTGYVDWKQFAADQEMYFKLLNRWEAKYAEYLAKGDYKATDEWLNSKAGKPPVPPSAHISIGEPSPKVDALFEIIDEHPDEQFVVFSCFPSVAEMVRARCEKKGIQAVKYAGGNVSQSERDLAVSKFQDGYARVFSGTIGAAGTSITLNSAHTAVFLDRHWNPSKNEQAEDRIYRIDNDAVPVQITDIHVRDSIDQYKSDRIETKARWLREFLTPRK